jgi:predicted nucleic acid-binding Zn ribbon protein
MTDGRTAAKKFTHIGDILQRTLQTCRRETNEHLVRVGACWLELVGETLGEHSRPAAIKGKLLLVHVNSSVWLHEMRFLKTDLIDKINRLLGQPLVKDIKFKVA